MKYISIEKDGYFSIIKLNRPERLNALSRQLLLELEGAIGLVAKDEETRIVIITGEGRAFSAGADFKEVPPEMSGAEFRASEAGHRVMKALAGLEKITIAAINGLAVGGAVALAIYCDLIVAAEGATFSIPELARGMPLLWGATPRLVSVVGPLKAKELILTRDVIDAKEALRIGLVNRVVPTDELITAAKEMGNKIASGPPMAVIIVKNYINAMLSTNLADASVFDSYLGALCVGTEDFKEGVASFLEKREPRFTGR